MNAPVQKGDLLAGKYLVDEVLGTGGMAVVVAAHHVQLDEKVAIKFLLPEALRNPEIVERFASEARAAVKVKSEHVARVSDVGTLETGAPYMVMEYLEGGDLAGWLDQKGPLPVELAVEFVIQACEALAEAHGLGIVHRDLKPANLFVIRRADGLQSVKVLDFGISKITQHGRSGPDLSLTKSSALLGSPMYMSPEQLESAKSVDARTDIWALGAVLYELLTGRPPFQAEALPELVVKILGGEIEPPQALRADIPVGLQQVVMRCLTRDRRSRYANVAELSDALEPFAPERARSSAQRVRRVIQASGLSETALATHPPPDAKPTSAVGTLSAWGQTTSSPRRGPALPLIAALAAIVGVGAFLYIRADRADASKAAPEPDRTAVYETGNEGRPAAATPTVSSAPPAAPARAAASATEDVAVEPMLAEPSASKPAAAAPVRAPARAVRKPVSKAPSGAKSPPASAAASHAPETQPRATKKGSVFDDRK